MRLSRIAWLILGIGIIVIAAGSLFAVYLQQKREQAGLNESLAVAQNTLPPLASERTELESNLAEIQDKLAQAESQLVKAKANFPDSVESIEVDERLFRIADDWDLEITNLTASEPREQNTEDIVFPVTSFTVEVSGEVSDILEFFNAVVIHDDFTTLNAEVVSINIPEPLSEEEQELPSATISVVIYAYEGEGE